MHNKEAAFEVMKEAVKFELGGGIPCHIVNVAVSCGKSSQLQLCMVEMGVEHVSSAQVPQRMDDGPHWASGRPGGHWQAGSKL